MKYSIITLFLLSFIIVSAITFDDAFAIQYKQNEHPLINQHSIDIQNTTTIILFTEGEYSQDDTLNLVCEDSHPGVVGVKWFIKNTDNGKITTSMQSQTYSFLGSELELGDYEIKCRIGFGDGHRSHSEWVKFSIVSGIVNPPEPPNQSRYDPPILEFEEKVYTYGDTITVKCIPDDSRSVKDLFWIIISDDGEKYVLSHEPAEFTFQADEYPGGDYSIKCRTEFGNGHNTSEPAKFSISAPVVTILADINYNPTTHDISIEWDFGTKDNRTCYTKTDFGIDYMINGALIHDPYHTFFGTDITLYDVHGMFNDDIVNEELAKISCQGDFTFNITDFQLLNDFSGFGFWMSFYEKIDGNPQILNEVGMAYSEDRILKSNTCYNITPDLYTDIYYDTEKFLKIIGEDEISMQCDEDYQTHEGVKRVDYTSVDSITYLEYPPPPHDNNIPNIHNTHKKSAGTCSDCTAPDILVSELTQNIEIGKPNIIPVSSWEKRGPYYVQLIEIGLGVTADTPIEDAQARIQVWMGYWLNTDIPNVKHINVIDPNGILATATATVTLDDECEKPNPCLDTQFHYTYAKEPNYDGVITSVSDFYKNTATNYYLTS